MTEKQLNNLYFIRKRIRRLKRELKELEENTGVSGQNLTGTPRSTMPSNPIEKLLELQEKKQEQLKKALLKAEEEEAKINAFISTVESEQMKLIIELRYIDNLPWADVGAAVGLSRAHVSRKTKKFLEKY